MMRLFADVIAIYNDLSEALRSLDLETNHSFTASRLCACLKAAKPREREMIMGMKDLYQRQCQEEKEQLERSLADVMTMIAMLEKGVKQYPENTAFKLSQFYVGMLKDAQLGKETLEERIAELSERMAQ